MKLKELQDLIFDDLILDDGEHQYKDIYKYGEIFEKLSNSEVIGIRTDGSYLIISVR